MTSSYPDNVTPLFGAPRQKPPKRAVDGGKPAGKRSPGGHRGEKLDQNVAHFVRALRRAGLRLGPAATLDCVEACRAVDIGNRVEFYHALSSSTGRGRIRHGCRYRRPGTPRRNPASPPDPAAARRDAAHAQNARHSGRASRPDARRVISCLPAFHHPRPRMVESRQARDHPAGIGARSSTRMSRILCVRCVAPGCGWVRRRRWIASRRAGPSISATVSNSTTPCRARQGVVEFDTVADIDGPARLDAIQRRRRTQPQPGATQRTHKMRDILVELLAPMPAG